MVRNLARSAVIKITQPSYYFAACVLIFSMALLTELTRADSLCVEGGSSSPAGDLFDSGGSIQNYSNGENCSFLISPGAGAVTLSFSAFNVQGGDGLSIYDGANNTAPLLVSDLNGLSLPGNIIAYSGIMYVVFQSNNGGNRPGWSASWSTAAVPAATPFAEWRFDESTWNGAAGEVIDSISGFNGTAVGSSPVEGLVCNAADLSANSTTDYLSLGAASLNGATDFTLSAWGKTTNTGSKPIFSGSSGSQHNELIMWFPNATTFTPYLKGNGRGSIRIPNIADDNWHHFVWTRSGAQNCIYTDGVLRGCVSKGTQSIGIASGGLILGQEQDALGGAFDINQDWEGLLDEPLVFRRAIATAEIAAIYKNQLNGNGWDGTPRNCLKKVAEYRFEQLEWQGAAGAVLDSSGADNHGTVLNGVVNDILTPAITGDPGTCRYADFNGMDQYIQIPHNDTLNGSNALTYAAWVYPRSWSGIRQIMAKSVHGGGSGRAQMGIFSEGNVLKGRAETTNGRKEVTVALPAINRWSHVALVYEENVLTIYVNGRAATPSTFSATSLKLTTDPLNISKRVGTDQYFFDGFIDETRVYIGALSSVDVNRIQRETHPCPGKLDAEWRFDEVVWDSTPNEVLDTSESEYHATALNSTPVPGLVCSAADLSSNSTQDYLTANVAAMNGQTDFTISVWGKTASSGSQAILSGSSGSQHNELIMWFPNSRTFTPYLKGDGSGSISIPNLADDNWHHLVWARSGAQNCFYLDGNLQGCASKTNRALSIASGGLIVGQEQDSLGGRYDINQDYQGLLDEFLIFGRALTLDEIQAIQNNHLSGNSWDGSPRVCPDGGLDHYAVRHIGTGGGIGVTCEAEQISVIAHDKEHKVVTPGSGTIFSISTGTGIGDWNKSPLATGIFNNGRPDDGSATYQWDSGETNVDLFVNQRLATTPPHIDFKVQDNNGVLDLDGDPIEDAMLQFVDTAFRFYAGDGSTQIANNIDTQIAGKPNGTVPNAQVIELRAVQTDSDTGSCETILEGAQSVEFAYQCLNPATCISGETLLLNDNPPAITSNPLTGITGYSNVDLNFGTTGTATFRFEYSDVGLISLHARKFIPASGEEPEINLTGASNPFVVRPFGFDLKILSNPGAGSAADPQLFAEAGEAFEIVASAVAWQNDDDDGIPFGTARDGIPDGHESDDVDAALKADLSDNHITSNFGQELNSAEEVEFFARLDQPAAGINPGLTGGTVAAGFVNGTASTTTILYDEVGIIEINAVVEDGNYLSLSGLETDTIRGHSGYVGRFYPHRLLIADNDPELRDGTDLWSCDFTYQSQPFGFKTGLEPVFTITAESALGTVTENYGDLFWKLNTDLLDREYDNVAIGMGATFSESDTSNAALLSEEEDYDGIGKISLLGDELVYFKSALLPAAIDIPFIADINLTLDEADLTDADGVCYDPDDNGFCDDYVIDNLSSPPEIRWGRMVLDNALGPELLDLELALRTEHWATIAATQDFVVNTLDNMACSGTLLTDLPAGPPVWGDFTLSDYGVNLNQGETSLAYDLVSPLIAGEGEVRLTAPGNNNEGSVRVTIDLTAQRWLKFPFNGDGGGDLNPSGLATFGQYRGQDRVIFWREVIPLP